MEGLYITIFRTIIGFSFLLLLTRLLGKKQLGEITFFNYTTGIAMGNIVGDMIVHKEITVIETLAALAIWGLSVFLIEWINHRSQTSELITKSKPSILINKGEIMQEEIRKLHMSPGDLLMLLRNKDVFSLLEVDYAIMETNGQLSVLKKPAKGNIPDSGNYLPAALVTEGTAIKQALTENGLTQEWLQSKIKEAGISAINEVFLAQLQEDGELLIIEKK